MSTSCGSDHCHCSPGAPALWVASAQLPLKTPLSPHTSNTCALVPLCSLTQGLPGSQRYPLPQPIRLSSESGWSGREPPSHVRRPFPSRICPGVDKPGICPEQPRAHGRPCVLWRRATSPGSTKPGVARPERKLWGGGGAQLPGLPHPGSPSASRASLPEQWREGLLPSGKGISWNA